MTHLILRNLVQRACIAQHFCISMYKLYCHNLYCYNILYNILYKLLCWIYSFRCYLPTWICTGLCITHTYTQNRNIPHPCVDSVDLYVTPWMEGLLRRKISSLARRNFELLLTRIHGVCFAVDDGESSLALDEHVALNFPGRLSHLECTGSTKVNRRKQSRKITRRSQTSHKINTIKQELRLQFYKDKGRISLGIWIETRLAFLFHVTL